MYNNAYNIIMISCYLYVSLILLGEFGIIYEARLVSWRWYPKDMPVAVKRFKCES